MPHDQRIRLLSDARGRTLRISTDRYLDHAVIVLERPDDTGAEAVMLDTEGAELIAAYIMAARIASPGSLAPECWESAFPASVKLLDGAGDVITVGQPPGNDRLDIPAAFWDRLYAELCLVIPRTRSAAAAPHPALKTTAYH